MSSLRHRLRRLEGSLSWPARLHRCDRPPHHPAHPALHMPPPSWRSSRADIGSLPGARMTYLLTISAALLLFVFLVGGVFHALAYLERWSRPGEQR